MTYTSRNYKAFLWDYDYLLSKSDDECCFSLSEREVQILLAQIDTIGWKTRYKPTSTEIDQDLIDRWMGNLARKLMSGCCPDDGRLTRFTSEGVWEISDDNGETWVEDLASDPRQDYVAAPPLPGTGESIKCAAADNARDQFKSYRDAIIEGLEASSAVLVIIASLIGALGFLAGVSVAGIGISVLLFGISAGLLSMTPEMVSEQLSDEVMDDFRCILFCHVGGNGQFTYDAWLLVLSDIDATWSGFTREFFHGIVAALGHIGLSNAGTIGAATAEDCAECDCASEWCYTFDFTTGQHGWDYFESGYGAYTSSVGFTGQAYGTGGGVSRLRRSFSDTQLTSIQTVHSAASGFVGWQKTAILHFNADPPQTVGFQVASEFVGTDILSQYNQASFVPFDCDVIDLYFDGGGAFDITLTSVTLHGVGVNPFGEDNCI